MKYGLYILDEEANPNGDKDDITDEKVLIFTEVTAIVEEGEVDIDFVVENFFVIVRSLITPEQVNVPNMLPALFVHRKRVMPPIISI